MRAGLIAVLGLSLPYQDSDLARRLDRIADQACDYDPAVRVEAVKAAETLCKEQSGEVAALARSRQIPALIALALAGRQDAGSLLKLSDRRARHVACDLLTPTPSQIAEITKLLDEKDAALRLAACRALGRVTDAAARAKLAAWLQDPKRQRGPGGILYAYLIPMWHLRHGFSANHLYDGDPERAEIAVAALCNSPRASFEGFDPRRIRRVFESGTGDPGLRLLLVRVLARNAPSALVPLLDLPDARLRSEIVDALDRGLRDPMQAEALHAVSRAARNLDDGKNPSRRLSEWIEKWLKRLCGDEVTLDNFESWLKANARALLDRRVEQAIANGVAGLRTLARNGGWSYNGRGYPVGVTGLAVYALLKCDVPVDDEAVVSGLRRLLDDDPEGTYSAGLVAMALATAVEKSPKERKTTDQKGPLKSRLQRIADILVASQGSYGGWSYGVRLKTGTTDEYWSATDYDFSNTQFAVLGLRAAANGGAKVPKRTWERALALYEKCQGKDGTWGYVGADGGSESMTAAGACSWMICKLSLDPKLSPEETARSDRIAKASHRLEQLTDRRMRHGLADLYGPYSLERMCMTGKIEKLGDWDWYCGLAPRILERQSSDGTWNARYGPEVDTCFALLFLKRAFIGRQDVATDSGERPATEAQAAAAFRKHHETIRAKKGVRSVQIDKDEKTSFIRVVAESKETARALRAELGPEIDGVPLRFVVE
ncbi:MAG: terpene cyclase/mutase family protein [Planctomycetes bacterium]|nr:terpene cyclase/mutase family protein [Planctomycetota bacterium]